jgi:two-component system chemotaxis sensor kinase CheA
LTKDLTGRLRGVFLIELDEQARLLSATLVELERDPSNIELIKAVFRVAHTLKGAARAVSVSPIERMCHSLESMLTPARDQRLRLGPEHLSVLFAASDALADAADKMSRGESLDEPGLVEIARRAASPSSEAPPRSPAVPSGLAVPPSPAKREARDELRPERPTEPVAPSIRLAAEKLDYVLAATDDLRMVIGRIGAQTGAIDALEDRALRLTREWRSLSSRVRQSAAAGADPAVGEALRAVEELLAPLARQVNRVATMSADARRQLGQAGAEVSDRARRLRMRPFQEICEALPRAARDVASERRREVEVRITGGDVEADRAILDALRDPLLHLVRNAVDHGIEDPDRRVAAGKPRTGIVRVAAEVRAHQLVATVGDDGAGIAIPALRATLGLSANVDDRDVVARMFQSGVTSRREATAISGRGVGLDLVRTALERIGGTVTVDWRPGEGTTFVMHCPLTLAAIRAVLVGVGAHSFAVPLTHVTRLMRFRRDALRQAEGRAVLPVDGGVVPIVRLSALLGPPFVDAPFPEMICAILLESLGRRLVLVVDALLDEREITVRGVEHGDTSVLLSGATVLADRGVAPVLNVAAIVEASANRGRETLPAGDDAATAGRRSTILVADDSITTRVLEQSMLEAAGYEVFSAVDGRDAWHILEDRAVDLVVSDIEMPGMDGIALCRMIRSSPRMARLPVILVTALEQEAQRAAGLAAGADAYIGKSTFDQRTLLDVVRQFLG